LIDVILEIYGLETAHRMLEISGGEVGWQDGQAVPITVTGMVGAPSVNKAGRDSLSSSSTGASSGAGLLTRAVEEAYQGLLMQGRHPIAIITLTYRRRRWMSIFTRPRRR